jgi:prepilin-type N-terminal cleavage/methylation domain-containing protein
VVDKMAMNRVKMKGFTLLETMLVLAIMGGMLVLAINYGSRQLAQQKRDKTAIQVQQILNASLAYYISYGTWPGGACAFASNSTSNSTAWSGLSSLTSAGYLPTGLSLNSYGYAFSMTCDSVTQNVFYVVTRLSNRANALVIAGELPVAYLSDQYGNPNSAGTYVTAQVTTPGQNLNNARSVNFSGVYHHGGCVPVPNCPGYNPVTNSCISGTNCMTPQIMVAPVSASGVSDTNSNNVYPITSFTAYAYGPSSSPMDCQTGTVATACSLGGTGIPNVSGVYWRVCLQVVPAKGVVATTNTGSGASAWGQYGSLMVVTRCTPPNEPYGSDFSVFTP